MQVSNGNIEDFQEFEKKFGKKDLQEKISSKQIVPVPDGKETIVAGWGRKKRERYAELFGLVGEEKAFNIVENCQGKFNNE